MLAILGMGIKYGQLLAILALQCLLLFRSNAAGDCEALWRQSLQLSAMAGLMGSLLAQDLLAWCRWGKPVNLIAELTEKPGKALAVPMNGLLAGTVYVTLTCLLFALYVVTDCRALFFAASGVSLCFLLSIVLRALAAYLRGARALAGTAAARFLQPVVFPGLLGMAILVLTNEKISGFVYRTLQTPDRTPVLILVLLGLLAYVLAAALCHFTNLYCILGALCMRKNLSALAQRRDALEKKQSRREELLQIRTAWTDERAPAVGFGGRVCLAARLFGLHLAVYHREAMDAAAYLVCSARLWLGRYLAGLLDADCMQRNCLRFCEGALVFEVLALNLLLFYYRGSGDTTAQFFELFGTVLIIPILLSSLLENKRKRSPNTRQPEAGIQSAECSAVEIVPYSEKYRDDMIFMVLEAKNALGRVPRLNEDLLDIPKHYLATGDGFWLAVDARGRVAGCIGYNSIPGTTEAVLHRLYVQAARKRQGIGTQLLQTAESHLRRAGKTVVHVHLGGEAYWESRAFYPKRGYTATGPDWMQKAL